MTPRDDAPTGTRRESIPAVLAVAFGLVVILVAGLSLFGVRMEAIDGAALLDERFASHALPPGMQVVEGTRLVQGEEVVILSDPATWADRRAEEASVWGPVIERQSESSHGFGGGGPGGPGGGGSRRGRGRPGGSFGPPGGGAWGGPQVDWSTVEESAPGQAPWEVALVWYPRRLAERVLSQQFGRRGFGDLSMVGAEGGKVTISSGPVTWKGYETYFAIERLFAKIDGEKTFRDTLRVNLTLGQHCCVLYAKWPAGTPGSIDAVSKILDRFEPVVPEDAPRNATGAPLG